MYKFKVIEYLRVPFLTGSNPESGNLKTYCPNQAQLAWPEVELRSIAPIVRIYNKSVLPELFYWSPLYASLVMASECEVAFFPLIAFSHLCCGAQLRKKDSKESCYLKSVSGQRTYVYTHLLYSQNEPENLPRKDNWCLIVSKLMKENVT